MNVQPGDWKRRKTIALIIAAVGIAMELTGIALLVSKRLSTSMAVPLVIVGMLLAFVPVFLLARKARRG